MKRWGTIWLQLCVLFGSVGLARAETESKPPPDKQLTRSAEPDTKRSVFKNYSIRLGMESAGPVLFRDTADARLEDTTVFQFGGRLAFLFGNELYDMHRFGLGVSYNFVGKSATRKLNFTDVYLLYETGHPLILQAAIGANIAGGTKAFAEEYGGVYAGLALRYSFIRPSRFSKVSVSPGLVAKSYLVTADARMSSFFVGAQLEFAYNTNK